MKLAYCSKAWPCILRGIGDSGIDYDYIDCIELVQAGKVMSKAGTQNAQPKCSSAETQVNIPHAISDWPWHR